jgi:hypothetical protein
MVWELELGWALELEWAKLPAWISSPRSSQNFQESLCTPLPCSNMYCLQEVLRRLRSFLFPGNRHAGCSSRRSFHNRLDSHLYLGLKDWRATTTSMWLQPARSRGGVHWIAPVLRQRRPRGRFYCASPRTSRTRLQPKSRHNRSQRTLMLRFSFLLGERASGLADYSSTPASVSRGNIRASAPARSADLGPSWVDKGDIFARGRGETHSSARSLLLLLNDTADLVYR